MPEGGKDGSRPLDAIGLITVLITVSAAVLIYMGWAYLEGYLQYFNLRATDLGYGADEYAIYGVNLFDTGFLPWMVAIPLALAVAAHRARLVRFVPQRLRGAGARLRSRVPIVADRRVVGGGLALAGLVCAVAALNQWWQTGTYQLLGLSALGLLLLTWPSPARGSSRIAFAFSVAVAIFSLLWAASLYANGRGTRMAEQAVRDLPGRTQVVIWSKDDLSINPAGVDHQKYRTGKYRHSYTGMLLLLVRDDRYYLVPPVSEKDWRDGGGRTYVLPQNDDIRLEILPGRQPGRGT
ncbi:hypothetical protein AB0J35_38300 [Nonomuraea angiospora]|uniref:hypothetical protein n=1 Tax=Nonomuraea angiospora TaxID=46172 RepID=UPI0034431ADE